MPKSKIREAYQLLLNRLPSTYPQPELIIHQSIQKLRDRYDEYEVDDNGNPPYAFCNAEDNTIHVSVVFNKETQASLLWFLLHELGHSYALQKYGEENKRWKDIKISEQYANTFADRWAKRLKKEGWF